ncbi:MAG: DEAD/DEAH box helicase [Candidatus Liptonbacteria bacterium]|nr:DEAD/DEAH box helicase [Candidatus Liptonbacteria bacterium]
MINNEKGFYGLGIAPGILQIIEKIGFKTPTPIQEQSIPIAIQGNDVMGIAQTGTGKTLAFGIPLIQRLLEKKGLALIVLPTRELAIQVDEALQTVGYSLGIKTAVLIGGEPIGKQFRSLSRNPQILIGTPGRIIDHMEQKSINLSKVTILVLDEADRMLDMGFAPQLRRIHVGLSAERQTMFFSATMPEEIINLARAYLKLPIKVEIARSGSTAKDVTQELFFVSQEVKPWLLEKILQDYKGSVLIFTRMKYGAKRIAAHIRAMGHTASEIHSNRSLPQRKEALEGFKRGRYRVLVATDIASRGIDVTNIELVINYDLPENAEDYVHRIGRTARAGESGHAISFARPNERNDVYAIERLIRSSLPVSKLPILSGSNTPMPPKVFEEERRPQRRFGAPSGSGSYSGGGNRFAKRPGFTGRRPKFGGGRSGPYRGR